jgi:hypothetical protein
MQAPMCEIFPVGSNCPAILFTLTDRIAVVFISVFTFVIPYTYLVTGGTIRACDCDQEPALCVFVNGRAIVQQECTSPRLFTVVQSGLSVVQGLLGLHNHGAIAHRGAEALQKP